MKCDLVQSTNRILVAVRVRPLTETEAAKGVDKCVQVIDDNWLVLFDTQPNRVVSELSRQRGKDKYYEFDSVLNESSTQTEVFIKTSEILLESVMNGYNASVFAYGPTGSGKSYTMFGESLSPGITYNIFLSIYDLIQNSQNIKDFKLSISFLEIYNENIRDLLNVSKEGLEVREDPQKGIRVSGLTEKIVPDIDEALDCIKQGTNKRITEYTRANQVSSRSHAVIIIHLESKDKSLSTEIQLGKLTLIDLAGSERASKTKNQGQRLLEGANINRSLLSLGNCINALAGLRKGHVPYRDSKLTRLLKDSFGGNCRTVMIACISPAFYCYEDSLNTLVYATRTKSIKNKARKNVINIQEHISKYSQIINQLKKEVKTLKEQLGSSLEKPKLDNFLILINEHFKEEAGVRKAIYVGQEKIGSLGFKLFELQTRPDSRNKEKNNTEIEKIKENINELEEEELQYRKRLSKMEEILEEMEENWVKSGVDLNGLSQLKLEVRKNLIKMRSLDFKGIESSNRLMIEQKDMYIKFLESQLRLRDSMINKESLLADEKTMKSYKSFEEISSYFFPSAQSSPIKNNRKVSFPDLKKSRIPALSSSPGKVKLKHVNREKGQFIDLQLGKKIGFSVDSQGSASTNLSYAEKKRIPTISEKYFKSPFIKNWKISFSQDSK